MHSQEFALIHLASGIDQAVVEGVFAEESRLSRGIDLSYDDCWVICLLV